MCCGLPRSIGYFGTMSDDDQCTRRYVNHSSRYERAVVYALRKNKRIT